MASYLGLIALAAILGLLLGAFVWVTFQASFFLARVVWDGVVGGARALGAPGASVVATVVLCLAGGALIGWQGKRTGSLPEPFMQVIARARKTGRYDDVGIVQRALGVVAPQVFGGAVGLAAGLVGVIATGCTYIGATLREAGLRIMRLEKRALGGVCRAVFGAPLVQATRQRRMRAARRGAPVSGRSGESARAVAADAAGVAAAEPAGAAAAAESSGAAAAEPSGAAGSAESQDAAAATAAAAAEPSGAAGSAAAPDPLSYDYRRWAKTILYSVAIFAGIAAFALLTIVLGTEATLPRFAVPQPSDANLAWAAVCVCLGWAGIAVFSLATRGSAVLARRLTGRPVASALVCGAVLGAVAAFFPGVLFSGIAQTPALLAAGTSAGAPALMATGLFKFALVAWCIALGWKGGQIYPCVFAAASCGLGLAALSGADPAWCLAVTVVVATACLLRSPALSFVLLMLCFPLQAAPLVAALCLVGAALPVPKAVPAAPSATRAR